MRTQGLSVGESEIKSVTAYSTEFNKGKRTVERSVVRLDGLNNQHTDVRFSIDRKQAKRLVRLIKKEFSI